MKIIFITLALFSLATGLLGIILPVLPTTPFLLLTGYFLARSSDKLNDMFTSSRLYKKYLKEFVENKSMTKKRKWTLLIFVDVMMIISFILSPFVIVKIVIVILEIGKYFYFIKYIETV